MHSRPVVEVSFNYSRSVVAAQIADVVSALSVCAVKHDPATYIMPAVVKSKQTNGPVEFSASIIVDVRVQHEKRSRDVEEQYMKLKPLPASSSSSSSSSSVLKTYKQLFLYCKAAFAGTTL
jgi:hypothetical protein